LATFTSTKPAGNPRLFSSAELTVNKDPSAVDFASIALI
jgi:hypothetical protein